MPKLSPAFDVSASEIRKIELDRPWQWLLAGWRDFTQTLGISMTLGAAFALTGYVLSLGLWFAGLAYLILPLAAGFLILSPILALGFYEVSRRRAAGEPVELLPTLGAFARNPRQFLVMGFVLLLVLLTWIRLAIMIFMLYWGLTPPPLEELLVHTFLRPEGLPFLILGTAVGAVFAGITFAITVVSIPMLLDQSTDVMTAMITSIRTVRENPTTMLFWAVLIVGFIGAGIVTLFLGLVVTLPLIGYATWHAYKDLVVTSVEAD